MSTVEPGTVMYKLRGQGWITRDTVERITPTGIVVLSGGTRLNPSSFGYQHKERGASVWETSAWYPEDNERVINARAYSLELARRDDCNRQLASVLAERAAFLADREPSDE